MPPTQLPGITADGIYTVTEKMLQKLEWQNGYQLDELRSRPHIQTPERYTGTCAMQEKCIDYADFCESIMDEITENEDEDPPCPIKCAKRVNPNQADCAEAARAATLKTLEWAKKHHWPTMGGHRVIGFDKLKEYLEQQAGEQR